MATEYSSVSATSDRFGGASDDMLRILVATDNHIGYMEKDPVRYNDSLESFEEVLQYAKTKQVDFILLGGDLYHDNKPSRQTLCRSMELLRKYCMGDRPCPIEYCSNPARDFHHSKFQGVNYEDPNYNVSIPVFSIHGNHDDPVGEGSLSAMDILHISNLINYFGKITNIEEIEVSPLLLRKGRTNLALYGLGSCRDERLHRMFRKGKVKFLRPSEGQRDWFNILVLHQNRAKHGSTNYIPPSFIPDFFDLIIWGHEHECLIEPEFVPTGTETDEGEEKGIFISQPGSSVATSLSDGEQKPKKCGLLHIKSDCTFKMEPIELRTVRPFILESLNLASTGIHPQDNERVESYLTSRVGDLIEKANASGNNGKLPLIRLKVDYSGGYSTFSLARFGQKFLDKAANPKNLLLWHHRREKQVVKKKSNEDEDLTTVEERAIAGSHISEYLEEEVSRENIELLSCKNMSEALFEFVEKMENDSMSTCVKYSLEASQNLLRTTSVRDEDLNSQVERQREELFKVQEVEGMNQVREELATSRLNQPDPSTYGSSSDEDNHSTTARVPEKPTRGRGRGRGSRGARGGARGATAASSSRGSGRGRGRGRKTASSSSSAASNVTASASYTPVVTSSAKRGTKRAVIYDSESDEDVFGTSKKKKKKKMEDKDYDSIDLTQDDSDGDDFSHPSHSTQSVRPVTGSRRSKK